MQLYSCQNPIIKAYPRKVTLSNFERAAGREVDTGCLGGPSRDMIDLASVVDAVAGVSFI